MKYTIKTLHENEIKKDNYSAIYEVDGNRIAICRDSGSLGGRYYFHLIINGKVISTRCKEYTAEKKAIEYLNNNAE